MPKFFDTVRPGDHLAPEPFGFCPEDLRPEGIAEAAEKLLDKPVPALPATLYMKYYRTGNRSEYERPYFARRDAMLTLLMAERTEGKGRFMDLLTDYVWAVCEETSWVIPAHNAPCHGNPVNCLPDSFCLGPEDDMRHVDLFSAATGAALAWVWSLGAEILDGVTPAIRRRISELLDARIFHPYCDVNGENNWWMGENGERLNNWTPWIVSNALTAFMLCCPDEERKRIALNRSAVFLDRFTADYPADGGCDEGPGYWGVAGASYFDCLELIRDMTGGEVDLTSDPFVRRMCEYFADFRLGKDAWANFADASHRIRPDKALLARMGRLTGSEKLAAMAAEDPDPRAFRTFVPGNTTYRSMRNLAEPIPEKRSPAGGGEGPGVSFYPDLGVMIAKERGLALAAKAGHNAESHNHNDAGSFILWGGGEPVFVDPGVEQYTKDTFSSKRYTLWTMRSVYHNLPAFRRAGEDGEWIEQKPGGQYRAQILSCENSVLTLELKAAYPTEAGLSSFRRRIGLDGEGFFCEDRIVFDKPGEVRFSLMSRGEWQTAESLPAGTYDLSGTDARITADPVLGFEDEKVPLEDKLRREWGQEYLVRTTLTSAEFTDRTFTLRVRMK